MSWASSKGHLCTCVSSLKWGDLCKTGQIYKIITLFEQIKSCVLYCNYVNEQNDYLKSVIYFMQYKIDGDDIYVNKEKNLN